MNLALVGTGRMGSAVEDVAVERGRTRVPRFNSEGPRGEGAGEVKGAATAIDFPLPDVAVAHLDRYSRWGVPAVIGTTGWYDRLDEVREMIRKRDASIFYAANFSL